STAAVVVIVCDDVGAGPAPLGIEHFALRLRRELPGAPVLTAASICEKRDALAAALEGTHPERVVLGCRAASDHRGELLAGLRRAGAVAAGIDIVDLAASQAAGETAAH